MDVKPMNIIQKIFTTNKGQTVGEPTSSKKFSTPYEEFLAQIKKLSIERDYQAIQLLAQSELDDLEVKEEEYKKTIKPYNDAADVAFKKMKEILEQNFKDGCTILTYRHLYGGGSITFPTRAENSYNITFELLFDIDSLKGDEEK